MKQLVSSCEIVIKAGIPYNKFDGSFGGIAKYGSSKSAIYTLNYEVKALSSANSVEYNFKIIMDGIQQTIDRGQGKNVIGVLVADKAAWEQVANSSKGDDLKEAYNRLTEKKDGESNYLRLEEGLALEAQRGTYGLKDAVTKAEKDKEKPK